jgi:hypothetical protein
LKDSLVLCGCPFEPNTKDVPETWIKEIIKFRDNCPHRYGNAVHMLPGQSAVLKYGNETIKVSPERLQSLAKNSMGPKNTDREAEEAEANKINDAINQVQTLTISTSKNEFFRAKMLQEEEKRRQEKDLADLDRLVQKEREKERCIQTFLEREATRLARKNREQEAEQELTEIKKEVTEQVKEVKNIFSKKIMDMRREYEQKKMDKMKELTDAKLKITSMLIDSQSKGSGSNCKQDKQEIKDA